MKKGAVALIVAAAVLVGGMLTLRSDWFWDVGRPVFYKQHVNRYCGAYKLDPLWGMAVISAESRFARKAKSPSGAVGLMQVMPVTAAECAAELKLKGFRPGDLYDPETNIRLGVYHLSRVWKAFQGEPVPALAAYNAGAARVREWISPGRVLRVEEIPFPETREFVETVTRVYSRLRWVQAVKRLCQFGRSRDHE